LYVDSVDVSGIPDLELLEGEFAVHRWTKDSVDKVANADQTDKHSYGKLEVIFMCFNVTCINLCVFIADNYCYLLCVTFVSLF
jgi:hypothetical protein